MPRGAATVRRQGKRRATWALKFRDADGRQVWETLGYEPEWNEQKAERELGKRLEAVERGRWRKPRRETFATFAEAFKSKYLPARNLKPSTHDDYVSIIDTRLVPFFGDLELAKIDPVDIDAYAAEAMRSLSPKTIKNHLGLLNVMLKVAVRWRLIRTNPVTEVETPRVETKELNVLTEAEIARLLTTYREFELETEDEQERAQAVWS
jgi:integrase